MTAQQRPPQAEDDAIWVRLPLGRPFTQADLDEFPAGLTFELVDGMLLVTPGPNLDHQLIAGRLFHQLYEAAPAGIHVLFAPFDVKPVVERTLQPDLLVGRSDDFDQRYITRPLLAVEVRSWSTRLRDQTIKRAAYEEAGIPSYWLVDPYEPAMTVLELAGERYEEVARVSGEQEYATLRPFPVTIRLGRA